MTLSPFIGPKCQEIRAHLDSYLSGELLVETTESVQSHLGHCPACRTELDRRTALRARLREVLTDAPADTAALEQRILAGLGAEDRGPVWRRSAFPLAAAAALVLAVVLWRSLPAPDGITTTPTAGLPLDVSGGAGIAAVDLALYSDTAISHTYCAVKRDMPSPSPTPTAAAAQLESYSGLLGAIDQDLKDYTLADAHVCPNGDRRYAHLIYEKGSDRSSVFVTAKLAGGLPPGDGSMAVPGALMHWRRESGFSISAVETDRHVGFIVRDAESPDATFPTSVVAQDVAGYLKQIAKR